MEKIVKISFCGNDICVVTDSGKDVLYRLGEDYLLHRLSLGHTQASCRLHLSLIDGVKAASYKLCHICTRIDTECDYCGHDTRCIRNEDDEIEYHQFVIDLGDTSLDIMETELVELSVPEIKELLGNKDNRDDFYVFRASSGDHYIEGRTLRMKAFTLILCTDGMENGSVNLRDVSINKGSLLMSFPGNVLKIESGYPMATVRGIMLSQDFMRMMNVDVKNSMPLFMRLAYNPMIHLTQKQQEDIERYLDLLENISDNDNLAHRDQIVSGLVSSMFFRISDMYEQSTQVANDKELSVRNRREEYFAKFIIKRRADIRGIRRNIEHILFVENIFFVDVPQLDLSHKLSLNLVNTKADHQIGHHFAVLFGVADNGNGFIDIQKNFLQTFKQVQFFFFLLQYFLLLAISYRINL